MGISNQPPAGGSSRLASLFSAVCGASALGLTVAGCCGIAHAAAALLGLTAPALLVRAIAALLGVSAALLAEAGVFRLVGGRRRVAEPPPPRRAKELLVRLPRREVAPHDQLTCL